MVFLHCNIFIGICWITTFRHGYVTLWHSSWEPLCQIVSFLNCYFGLQHPSFHIKWICHIATFIKCRVTLWCSLRVFFALWCHIMTFIKGFVWLWHSSIVNWNCNIHFGLHYNMDIFYCDIHQWLCDIEKLNFVDLCLLILFVNGYVALWCRSNVMSHCHIHKGFCHIVTFIEGYFGLWHYFMFILNCNIHLVVLTTMSHCNINKISCHIVMFIMGFIALWH
jgi:hypothetical protein